MLLSKHNRVLYIGITLNLVKRSFGT
nr:MULTISPECIES: hypothetical protein [unclassified Wolbachia]